MKRVLLLLSLLLTISGFAQSGYEINVTFKPFKNQYIYLGHYFGNAYPVIDSAMLNDKSEAVLKGPKKLQGGIYLIGYPNRAGFFEFIVDKEQHFSIIADTATLQKGIQYVNSPDNELFNNYQQQLRIKGKEAEALQQQLKVATNKADSTRIISELQKLDKTISDYRGELMKKNPDNILTVFLNAMKEPELIGRMKEPKTKKDSVDAFVFYKSHFWEGVNFWDGRLAYTTFFEEKIDKYFANLVELNADSVNYELDRMLGPASINEEMTRFLLVKFVTRYMAQKFMWEDAILVHLFEKYFAQKEYPWLTEKGRKMISDRAYSLMSNIMGSPAAEIELPDSSGNIKKLYNESAPYTLVAFWDATCGHCKETLPKLDSFYRAKWKALGLKIFAVSKETDGTKKDWLDFINEKQLTDWTHVYYSKTDDDARINANIPGYSQLYDVQTFPTLYLLSKNKRIIAKKLTYRQIDEVLEFKIKGQ